MGTFDDSPLDQAEVFAREWRDIRARRREASTDAFVPPSHLTGLALSGGGIRSATFCLGVLQALSDLGHLGKFDYLSTVSGGGFVGGWWSAWIARDENTTLFPPSERIEPLNRTGDRPKTSRYVEGGQFAGRDPIHHLRLFANYLTPRKGILSPDTWRVITTIARNLMLTWAVLIPLIIAAILVAQLPFVHSGGLDIILDREHFSDLLAGVLVVPLHLGLGVLLMSLVWLLVHRGDAAAVYALGLLAIAVATASLLGAGSLAHHPSWMDVGWCLIGIALVLYALRSPPGARRVEDRHTLWRNQIVRVQSTLLVVMILCATWFFIAAFGYLIVGHVWKGEIKAARAAGMVTILSALWSAAVTVYKMAPSGGADHASPPTGMPSRIAILIAPPLVLIVLAFLSAWGTSELLWLAHSGRFASTASASSIPIFVAVATCAGFAIVDLWLFEGGMHPPAAVLLLVLGGLAARELVAVEIAPHWDIHLVAGSVLVAVVTVLGTLYRGHSDRRSVWLLATGIAIAEAAIVLRIGITHSDDLRVLVSLIALAVVWVVGLGWMGDPNAISLHGLYASRLIRAYLGASNVRRQRDKREITEAAAGDDVLLRDLKNSEKGAPYHLLNATLNLVGGHDLTTAQRFAAGFILSRYHCGSWRTGYRPTDEYMGGDLSLGTAMAISGAAVSPDMGSITPSAALSMLMTLLNIRLGYWAPTPNRQDWRSPQARLWPFYLLKESLSQTNDLTTYCYLTDGGHFDNTGIYALVERGCRRIVAIDCGADPNGTLDDLGNVIRRCRIDFNAEIDIDSNDLRDASAVHYVSGRITYDVRHVRHLGWQDTSPEARAGIVVVIKPGLCSGESLDVQQYGWLHRVFPQQTTVDQWFDEAQFESYRRLGYLLANAAFGAPSVRPVFGDVPDAASEAA